MNERYLIYLLLAVLMLGGCSENGNNPVEGISSFDVGISSSEPNIELSSSEEIYLSSSSEDDPLSSSSEEGLSSSSGVDYTNWVIKKIIHWDCEDVTCNMKRKSSETNYDYISYTDTEHYTVVSFYESKSYQSSAGVVIRTTWNNDQIVTTRNGLNYSGTRTLTKYSPDSLTLSYKREITFSEERHPVAISFYTHREETGQAITYQNGEISETENINYLLIDTFLDLGVIEGLSCYKHISGNSTTSYYIRCYDENHIWIKEESYTNDILKHKSIQNNVVVLNSGEFAIWTSFIEYNSLTNDIWLRTSTERVFVQKTNELIILHSKRYDSNSELHYINEIHYGSAI